MSRGPKNCNRKQGDNSLQVIFMKENVFDAALDRIRYLYDEFPNIIVSFSGGKDSTVCLNLTLQVAKERNRLPLKVLFIDQEAEWQATIDYVKTVMYDKRIEPLWFQMPMRIFNATSHQHHWNNCWGEGEKWIRKKDPISIKKNKYGTQSFKLLFTKIPAVEYPDTKTGFIGGVRAEENPGRKLGLTLYITYKNITWGKIETKKLDHYTFYPLYDWSAYDIWKAIHDNKWKYCKIYDYFYQYGHSIMKMRVSNVHHETAVQDLLFMQEIEKDTWEKVVERVQGVNTVKHLQEKSYKIKELPPMFKSWAEYRDYLLENLVDKDKQPIFRKTFDYLDKAYKNTPAYKAGCGVCVTSILKNDYHMTTMKNFYANPRWFRFNRIRFPEGWEV